MLFFWVEITTKAIVRASIHDCLLAGCINMILRQDILLLVAGFELLLTEGNILSLVMMIISSIFVLFLSAELFE